MMGFGLILTLLVVGAVAYAAGWRPQGSQPLQTGERRSALDVARERYARGEITKAEFDEIRATLNE